MTNKLRFIMPRLAGATLIAGVAALIITTVFKLLLVVTLLAAAITLVVRAISRKRRHMLQYDQGAMYGADSLDAFRNSNASINPVQPLAGFGAKKGTTIVPID